MAIAFLNFLVMTALAVLVFGVPVKGSFAALSLAAFLFVICATGLGLLVSAFTDSQIAAMFIVVIGTIIPCVQFSGLLNPVSSLEGVGAFIGRIYPATYFLTISRGVFNKALGLSDLVSSFWPLLLAVPVLPGLAIAMMKKQDSS